MGNNPKTLDNEFMIIMYLFKKKRMGKNDYLHEYSYFNPWVSHDGLGKKIYFLLYGSA